MLDIPTLGARVTSVIAGAAAAYVGIGRRIYKSVALTNGVWSDWVAVADLGAGFSISGLAYYLDDLLVLLATGQDIRKLNTATNALTVWRLGEKGVVGCGYKGQLIYAPRASNNEEELRLSGTKWNGNAVTHLRYLDSPILTMALFNGKVAIATRTSLWFMGGQPYPGEADDAAVTADTSKAPAWIGDPQPVMSTAPTPRGRFHLPLASYRGRLYILARQGGQPSSTARRRAGLAAHRSRRARPAMGRRSSTTGWWSPSTAVTAALASSGVSTARGGGSLAQRRPPRRRRSGPARWVEPAIAT